MEILNFMSKGIASAQFLTAVFLGILFVQSGFDKIFNWADNLAWLKSHFAKTPLQNFVPAMLFIITLIEAAAGLVSITGGLMILLGSGARIALLGAQLSALSLVMLFFGQRIAKDYAGAASLVTYFIISILAILLMAEK
jgi:uncharacterized membrane protein YphA (DoxX/SURF4 family)